MKKWICAILALLLIVPVSVVAEAAEISGKVIEIDEYGVAQTDITNEDFYNAGFDLGDVVTLTAGSFTGDMPCFNGYYADRGSCMLRVNPYTHISVCVNYGNFAEMAGLGVGDAVTIMLKEKGGALQIQEINNLVYSDDRADSVSDVAFANFRPVVAGKLYRSASPVDNRIHRAQYADILIQEAGVRTVVNLSNTEEEIVACMAAEDFASPYYKSLYESGQVIALGLGIDFAFEDFAKGIVKGFSFLAERDTPYLVHCLEGKDRAGFAAMVLEALMGWSEAQIVADYMQSYFNYYGIEPGTDKYDLIVEKDIKEMLRIMTGLEAGTSLVETDLQASAKDFLLSNGMAEETLKRLEAKLALK